MQDIEIPLTFRREDFEEIYYRYGSDKIFFSPKTNDLSQMTIIFGLLSFFFLISSSGSYFGFYFVFSLFCITSIILSINVYNKLKWKKSIEIYLDKLSEYDNYKIILSENTISVIQDSKETIEKWTEIKRLEMDETHIILFGIQNYIIPKKSVSSENYILLENTLRYKLKNCL